MRFKVGDRVQLKKDAPKYICNFLIGRELTIKTIYEGHVDVLKFQGIASFHSATHFEHYKEMNDQTQFQIGDKVVIKDDAPRGYIDFFWTYQLEIIHTTPEGSLRFYGIEGTYPSHYFKLLRRRIDYEYETIPVEPIFDPNKAMINRDFLWETTIKGNFKLKEMEQSYEEQIMDAINNTEHAARIGGWNYADPDNCVSLLNMIQNYK